MVGSAGVATGRSSSIMLEATLNELQLSEAIASAVKAQSARLALKPRKDVLDALKEAGVSKVGQRLKLVAVLLTSEQPEVASPLSPTVPPPPSTLALSPPASAPPLPPAPAAPTPAPSVEAWRDWVAPLPTRPDSRAEPQLRPRWEHPGEVQKRATVPTPTSARALGQKAQYYKVVTSVVRVRSAPALDADPIAFKQQDEVVETDAEQAGWVRLVERFAPGARVGWMLVDGSPLKLGMLLERVTASARFAAADSATVADDIDDAEIDRWLDDL